jgi:hypothetical protein
LFRVVFSSSSSFRLSLSSGSAVYSCDEISSLVAFGLTKGVRIIPEFQVASFPNLFLTSSFGSASFNPADFVANILSQAMVFICLVLNFMGFLLPFCLEMLQNYSSGYGLGE